MRPREPSVSPITVVSGGQTGADRAALDFALEHGLAHGGWCPRGRPAEDGAIPARYVLRETESAEPAVRTRRNVEDSDGTVIFSLSETLTGGTLFTAEVARELDKPLLIQTPRTAASELAAWIDAHAIGTLNVAGPRASGQPGIGAFSRQRLTEALLGESRH